MSDERVMVMKRWRAAAVATAGGMAMAVTALAAPLPASASSHAAAAGWTTHVFSISYDGKGTYSYSAQGTNGDTGCHMSVSQGANYGWNQLWTVKIAFKSNGKGGFDTEVKSVNHVSGPQLDPGAGNSHLVGKQTKEPGQDCADGVIVPNTGKFDCMSSTIVLTGYPAPQFTITRQGGDLVFIGRAFLDAHWKYTGSDSIPGDKKKCGTYDDDMTYGSDLAPGIFASAKISLPVSELAKLARKSPVKKPVGLNKNTDYPPQSECAAVFGTPNSCALHKQSLSGTFQVSKVR